MNKIAAPLAIITGLLGLALTTRSDILYSLPVGCVLIIICGVTAYIHFKFLRDDVLLNRENLIKSLSLDEIEMSLKSMMETFGIIVENQNIHHQKLIEELSEKHSTTLTTNSLLETLTTTLQSEFKMFAEQQMTFSKTAMELVVKSMENLEECTAKIENVLVNDLKTIGNANKEVAEQIKVLSDLSSNLNELLGQVLSTVQAESKVFISQQQNLYEIIFEDIKETLSNFSENQSRNAEDATDRIKRTMNDTNKALRDLPLSLERFNIQNAETMQKAVDGFSQFEILINETLEQLTSISNQDYELLKGMLK